MKRFLVDLKQKINIVDFCTDPQLLNMKLLPTQEILLRIMYGLPLTKEQKISFFHMSGEAAPNRSTPYKENVLILGRGSSKTTISAAICVYEGCCTNWQRFLRGKGEYAWVFVIATREQQAIDVGRNMIFSMIEASPILKDLIVDKVDSDVGKSMPKSKGGVMILKTGAAICALPCSAKVGRGYAVAAAILDEIAWFAKESKNEATDRGIYDAIKPRMAQFGEHAKMFLVSTPADKSGVLYDRWEKRERNRDLYFCCKIPTWKMRPDYTKKDFDEYKRLSPMGYQRELAAEFLSARESLIPRDDVEAVCRAHDHVNPIPYAKDKSYAMAIDTAFGDQDRFAIVIGHSEVTETSFRIVIDLCEMLSPGVEDFVEYAASRCAQLYKEYDIFELYGDQYNAETFKHLLENKGCNVEIDPWTAGKHRVKYGRLRNLIKRRMISLPYDEDLIDEISGLEVKFMPTSGQHTVTHKPNGHDDMADAVAEVTYRLSEAMDSVGGIYSEGVDIKV